MKQFLQRLLIASMLSGSAYAQILDGNKLLQFMNADTSFEKMYATGYITGVADSFRGTMHCPPANSTVGQMNDMVKNYLTNTPATRHLPGDLIVGYVLKSVWPCKEKGKSGGGSQL